MAVVKVGKKWGECGGWFWFFVFVAVRELADAKHSRPSLVFLLLDFFNLLNNKLSRFNMLIEVNLYEVYSGIEIFCANCSFKIIEISGIN